MSAQKRVRVGKALSPEVREKISISMKEYYIKQKMIEEIRKEFGEDLEKTSMDLEIEKLRLVKGSTPQERNKFRILEIARKLYLDEGDREELNSRMYYQKYFKESGKMPDSFVDVELNEAK